MNICVPEGFFPFCFRIISLRNCSRSGIAEAEVGPCEGSWQVSLKCFPEGLGLLLLQSILIH